MTDNLAQVRRYVSAATLALLGALTLASVINLHDMAAMTHAVDGLSAWVVALAIGATLSVLAYVASITDGATRNVATGFAIVAAITSATLQVSLFLERGAALGVAVAFGAGVPFFEIALALTDSMLRRYATVQVAPVQEAVATPVRKPRPVQVEPVAMEPAPVAPTIAPTIATELPEQPDKKTRALQMLQEGLPKAHVARELDVNPSTVHRWAASLNGSAA